MTAPHKPAATIAARAACTARAVVCVWRAPRATLCVPRRMRSEIRDFSKLRNRQTNFKIINAMNANASKIGESLLVNLVLLSNES